MARTATVSQDLAVRMFDVVRDERPDFFGNLIAQQLGSKGFCVVDMGIQQKLLDAALDEASELDMAGKFKVSQQLFHEGLLGAEGSARLADLGRPDDPGSRSSEVGQSLQELDKLMTEVAIAIEPLCVQVLGFETQHRSAAVLHEAGLWTPEREQERFDTMTTTEERFSEATTYLSLFNAHAVMCLVCLGPSTGTLELQPFERNDTDAFRVDMRPGDVILLRADALTHKRSGTSKAITMSCFFLRTIPSNKYGDANRPFQTPCAKALDEWVNECMEEVKNMQINGEEVQVPRDWQLSMNHNFHVGQRIAFRGWSSKFATSHSVDPWVLAQETGLDCVTYVPLARWNMDKSFDPDPYAWRSGKTYCRHGSFIDGMEMFDNKIFSISIAEARVMALEQRMILEIGLEACFSAGYNKSKLMNKHAAIMLGCDLISDSSHIENDATGDESSFGATGGAASIHANRFSFVHGMKGPSMILNVEAAAGLMAVYTGAESVQDKGRMTRSEFALCGGIHVSLAAYMWPLQQAAGLLSQTGRCLVWDDLADGYVHGEGIGFIVLKCLTKIVDDKLTIVDEDDELLGSMASGAAGHDGRTASIASPSGTNFQELLDMTLRQVSLSPLDVDAVECHAEGAYMADAIELKALLKSLRLGAEKDSDDVVGFRTVKSNTGNMVECSGISALMKTCVANRYGITMPNVHLNVLNPYVAEVDGPGIISTELLETRMSCMYISVTSRGYGGMSVNLLTWGHVDDCKATPAKPQVTTEKIVFWPGGGGVLDALAKPKAGGSYQIAGTWTDWHPERMQECDDGVYTYTVTIGENRWEQFQIWIDGDSKRRLHPSNPKGVKGKAVVGPDAIGRGSAWMIDARWVDYDEDGGLTGDRYRIVLRIAGKFRTVEWDKLAQDDAEIQPPREAGIVGSAGRYYLATSWSNWALQPMYSDTHDSAPSGRFYVETKLLTRSGGEFLIVMNGDWDQVCYPLEYRTKAAAPIGGPDDEARGCGCGWQLTGRAGNVFRIDFERTLQAGLDSKTISWTHLRDEELSEEDLQMARRPQLSVVGTWDDWTRQHDLRCDSSGFFFHVEVSDSAPESFQLRLDHNWNKVLHPNVNVDRMYVKHTVEGPSSVVAAADRQWTIGKPASEGDKVAGVYQVRATLFDRSVCAVEWERLPAGDVLVQAEGDALVLRRR